MKLTLLALSFFFSTAAIAASQKVPGFTGQLHNYSSLPNSAFEVRYLFNCLFAELDPTFPINCGNVEHTAKINLDGSFEVPAVEIPIEEEYVGKTVHFQISATIQVPEEAPGFPFQFSPNDLIRLTKKWLPAGDAPHKSITNFTIFESASQDLILNLKSSKSTKEWMQAIGRDLGAEFQFNFSGKMGNPDFYNDDPHQTHFNLYGSGLENWTKLPRKLFIVGGKWAANTKVAYEIKMANETTVHSGTFEFQPVFPEAVRTLTIDDSVYADPSQYRKIANLWKDGSIDLDYSYQSRFKEMADSTYLAADLKCEGGKISGDIIIRDDQVYERGNETARIPASGTCEGEKGLLEFSFTEANGKKFPVTAQIDRIHALQIESWISVSATSKDMTKHSFQRFEGDTFGRSIALRDKDKNEIGGISLTRLNR